MTVAIDPSPKYCLPTRMRKPLFNDYSNHLLLRCRIEQFVWKADDGNQRVPFQKLIGCHVFSSREPNMESIGSKLKRIPPSVISESAEETNRYS